MQLTGKVVDQATGAPLGNVTIWEFMPDGQSAEVLGFTDPAGAYNVTVSNDASNVNFVLDGYTGTNISAAQAALSDQVLLSKDGTVTAKISLSGVPSWLWLLLAAVGIYYVSADKKIKRR